MANVRAIIRDPKFALIILFALAVFLRILPGERMVDDAYITFRYARNIVNGAGFVYNPGERVMGTTTPLYTLLMAGVSLFLRTDNFPAISIWVNALADGLTCVLLAPLGELIGGHRRVGIAAGTLYAIAPFSVTFAIGGMETSVFVLLLTLTALLYLRRHTAWAFTSALALLTRPDALIFLGPIALDFGLRWLLTLRATPHAFRSSLNAPLSTLALFLAPLVPWLLFATLYFGSPIPHSVAAKVAAYHLGPAEGFIRLLQHYATPFFENLTFPSTPILLAFLAAYLSLSIIGILFAFRRDSHSLCIMLYPVLYFATFAIANPLIFRWYLTPPLPFYFLAILTGLSANTNQLPAIHIPGVQSAIKNLQSKIIFALPVLFFLFLTSRAWTLNPDHGPNRPAPEMAWFKLEQLYTQVGHELAPEVTPQTVIAAGDIGALGYFSGARILDTLGLISPQSTGYYPLPPDQLVINYAISADLIADQKPDYVVFLEVYGRRTLLADPRFLSEYSLQQKIPTNIYGGDGMLVYRRRQ
ncbi:MAG TPA: hypothetical protein VJL59_00780 [Anaerolineales bacterium]|nr:hypothetical protein [Anaerolineales bacterium]